MADINFEKERKKAYQREYYKKNKLINNEIKNMVSIREYAKLKKDEVQLVRRKRNYHLTGFKKISKKEPILVYFD